MSNLFKRLAAALTSTAAAGTVSAKAVTESTVMELRTQALAMPANQIGLTKDNYPQKVWAVLMDVGLDDSAAYTLVVLGDGTTSLYFSNGGGIIGAGGHEQVRAASFSLLTAAAQYADGSFKTVADELPSSGMVKFHLRTFDGTYSYAAPEDALGNGRDRFSPLFIKAHEVISQIRLQQEQSK